MRSGDLLVEVASRQQALEIRKLQALSTLSVSVKSHETLNTSKGVITCGRLLNLPIEEITQELSGQGVKDVRRINIRRDGELVPTKHFILTFNTPRLPEYIKAGYVRCSVRPYIPNPLRCFKCQRFGHSKTNCRGTLTCARCAVAGHESTGCKANEKCVNCQGERTSFSRSCPKWKVEKEVVAIKFKNNITFLEARRIAKAQSAPEVPSTSKSTDPVPIASSSRNKNKNISLQPSSETSAGPASQNASEFTIVKLKKKSKISSKNQSANNNQITTNTASKFWKTSPNNAYSSGSGNAHHKNKNKTDEHKTSSAKTVHSTSDASDGNSSDIDSDLTVTSAPEDLDTLVDQLPIPFILLGDFNGHSTLWGSDVTNYRGRQIERLISNNCLCLLNNDERTYFHEPTRTFHSLDLAICTPTLLPLLNFTVGSDLFNSDHFSIIVSYADGGGAIQYPPRYLFQRADWGNFMQLADITESMVSTADITEAVRNVVACLINAANNTIPKSSTRLRKFRRPW
ncbi:hypothetical protein AVEN_10091-1 [Araneus ventricosus]|uniref:CCHC-type domain-containing protein n=1 Tax=Araneus ventricosus TaxID=182803 RepID=A0A4Y2WEZ1_ARAVE|nr:hypothetical protein AVEN_10091-1 [Araneus ventricosus]